MIRAILVRLALVPNTRYFRQPLRGLIPAFVLIALCPGIGSAVQAHDLVTVAEDPPIAGAGVELSQPAEAVSADDDSTVPVADGMAAEGSPAGGEVMPGAPQDAQAPDVLVVPEGAAARDSDQDDEGSEAGSSPGADPAADPALSPEVEAGSTADPAAGSSAAPASDGDIVDPEEGEADGVVIQALESGQETLARTVVNLSRAMDRMLGAREVYPDELYDSILRVRLIQRLDDSGGSRLEPRVSGRLSLPGAEQRWSLIFFSDDYEDPLDRERGTDRELDERTRGSVALRYLKPLRDNAKTSLSVGLRTGPIDTILRGRLWYELRPRKLAIRPETTLFWYDERGLGASTWLRLEYPLSGLKLLRSESGATWFRRDERFYYDQIFSLLQPISKRRGLLWQIGMQAESRPNAHVTNYYAQVRYRNLIHRDWLVFELRPQLIRERENDFHLERRIYVGFELMFGDPFRLR